MLGGEIDVFSIISFGVSFWVDVLVYYLALVFFFIFYGKAQQYSLWHRDLTGGYFGKFYIHVFLGMHGLQKGSFFFDYYSY
jgi:hypothetical protein